MDEYDDEFKRAWAADINDRRSTRLAQGRLAYEGGDTGSNGMVRLGYVLHDEASSNKRSGVSMRGRQHEP